MNTRVLWMVALMVGLFSVIAFFPEVGFAQDFGGVGGDALSNRMNGLTNKIIGTILPAISILGLVYSAILAASGDQGAKGRMVLVLIACAVGFLAPIVIRWLQGAVNGGGLGF
jgi:hypothetical protein